MMRNRALLPFAVLLAVVLAACVVVADPFPNAVPVDPGDSSAPVVPGGSLANGSSIVYRINLASIANEDVVYLEVIGDLDLEVYSSTGTRLASSSSADFFAGGAGGLLTSASTQAELAPEGISLARACGGPCVIREASNTTLFAELTNSSGGSVLYDFFVFGDDFQDTGEVSGGPPPLTTSDTGAIETLGDIDTYQVGAGGTLTLTGAAAGNPVDILADVRDASNTLVATLEPGDESIAFSGWTVQVRSDSNRAGAPAASRYTLTVSDSFTPVTPGPVGSGNTPVVDNDVLAAGAGTVYEIDLASVANEDVVYLEVMADLDLKIYDSGGLLVASSSSADFFAGGTGGLLLAPSALRPQGITPTVTCRGPCVIEEASNTTLFAELRNSSVGSVSYDFYAFADDFQDPGEPGNDSSGGGVTITSSDQGAIETLGDVDYYQIGGIGTLTLEGVSTGNPVSIEALVFDSSDALIGTLDPGDELGVLPGETVLVRSDSGRAGASATSRYTLTLAAGLPGSASVDAGTANNPVADGSVLASGSVLFEIDFSGLSGNDAVYLEVEETVGSGDIDLFVYDASGDLVAESSDAGYFEAAGASSLSYDPQAVGIDLICRGPCVILEANGGTDTLFARLANRDSANIGFDFYAFGEDFQDTGEPGNDSIGGAVAFNSFDEGAIETVGDVDYFQALTGGILTFTTVAGNSDIDLRAEVIDQFTLDVVATLSPGQSTDFNVLFDGDFIRVSATNDRAGPSGVSGYTLTVTP